MRKGKRVYVRWLDISADLHTEEQCNPIEAECMGWVVRDTKKVLELAYCRYVKGCELADKIAIPRGCVIAIEEV